MADVGMIEALVHEMVNAVPKKIPPEEREAYVRSVQKHLGVYSNEELADAVDAWIAAQNDDHPPFKLPAVKTLRANIDLAYRRRQTDAAEEPAHYERPRPEFFRSHRAYQKLVATEMGGSLERHVHRRVDPDTGRVFDGPEICPICGPRGDDRRERFAELLASLPAPRPGAPRPCRCDGSGWLEVDDPYSRDVYPCQTCNPYYPVWSGASTAGEGR